MEKIIIITLIFMFAYMEMHKIKKNKTIKYISTLLIDFSPVLKPVIYTLITVSTYFVSSIHLANKDNGVGFIIVLSMGLFFLVYLIPLFVTVYLLKTNKSYHLFTYFILCVSSLYFGYILSNPGLYIQNELLITLLSIFMYTLPIQVFLLTTNKENPREKLYEIHEEIKSVDFYEKESLTNKVFGKGYGAYDSLSEKAVECSKQLEQEENILKEEYQQLEKYLSENSNRGNQGTRIQLEAIADKYFNTIKQNNKIRKINGIPLKDPRSLFYK